jgi:Tol biopolymer transport system component
VPWPGAGASIWNSVASEHAGSSAAYVGDVNGDGRGDLLIGVPESDPAPVSPITESGEAFVVYGTPAGTLPSLALASMSPAQGLRLYGVPAFSNLGTTVAELGDFDGDGLADFAIGAPKFDAAFVTDGGAIFVIRGSATIAAPLAIDVDPLSPANGIVLQGTWSSGRLGTSLCGIGDWNSDGFADLIAGAPEAQPNLSSFVSGAGEAYVLFGGPSLPTAIPAGHLVGPNGLQLEGLHSFGKAGTSVAGVGDLNADGFVEIAIGAPHAAGSRGQVHVIYGGQAATPPLILGAQDSSAGFVLTGADESIRLGQSIAGGGDWNADGIGDLAVGAVQGGVSSFVRPGAVYVVFGGQTPIAGAEINTSELDGVRGFTVYGSADQDFFGTAVSLADDLNGDAVADLAVGAPGHDPLGRAGAGAVYVVHGRSSSGLAAVIGLASLNGISGYQVSGAAAGDATGLCLDTGDENADASAELLIGIPRSSAGGALEAGGVRSLFGLHAPMPDLPTLATSPATLDTGGGAQALLSLKAGSAHAGAIYLLLGSSLGTFPGIPAGNFVLPLQPDPYFAFTLANPNSSLLSPSLAVLNSKGSGSAWFRLPAAAVPELAGLTAHHAFVTLDLPALAVTFASQAASTALVPYVTPPPSEITVRESVSTGGAQGNGSSLGGTLSGDGRWLVFQSAATTLVDGVTTPGGIFLRDRVAGTTTLASVTLSGMATSATTVDPWLSEDGRYVVFESLATDLVVGDTNNKRDIFARDLLGSSTARISVSSTGVQANGASTDAHISPDGRFVAFATEASNLVHNDTNGTQDVCFHDRTTGATVLVSVSTNGVLANGPSSAPRVSPDGRYVAFASGASNLDPADTQSSIDVYLHDLLNDSTVCASKKVDGMAGGNSSNPRVVTGGGLVFFESTSTSLVLGDFNAKSDVFVREIATGTTSRVSLGLAGEEANGHSFLGEISRDGRYVLMITQATNLAAGTSGPYADLVVLDLWTNERWVASQTHNGQEPMGQPQFVPVGISDDGRSVGFCSNGLNFVPLDNNTLQDVFVHTRP